MRIMGRGAFLKKTQTSMETGFLTQVSSVPYSVVQEAGFYRFLLQFGVWLMEMLLNQACSTE